VQPDFLDPRQLARVSDLTLIARAVVDGFMSGIHRSPNTGASIEFAQYRPYSQGDDPRFMDWKLYGRSDRLHLKQFHEETNMRCTLLLDCSASMGYGSISPAKFDYARMLCACLSLMLRNQGDAAGLVAFHRELALNVPAANDLRRHRMLMAELARLRPDRETDAPAAIRYLGEALKPRGMVALISDLLYPLDAAIDCLKSLRARRHDVVVLQISDPAERDFTFDRAITLIDAESGRERYVVPDAVRQGYLENRRRHFEAIRRECLAAEIDIAEFSTDAPLDHALRFFLHRRARALMTSGRRNRAGGRRAG